MSGPVRGDGRTPAGNGSNPAGGGGSTPPGDNGGTQPGGNGSAPGGNGGAPSTHGIGGAGRPGAAFPAGGQRPAAAGAGGTGGPGGFGGPGGQRPRGGPGMFGMGMGLPPQKSKDFRGSLKRLFGQLGPERARIAVVICLAVISVFFSVIGPRIMADAINAVFSGAISQRLPVGLTQQQVVEGLRQSGQGQLADMLSTMHLTPGVGIDFSALGAILGLLVGVYLLSSIFAWGQGWIMAGVTQRTALRLRQDVDRKLGRLPLRYFDSHPRGDVLSRVTNDIDNIQQSLQQSLTQLFTSLLTIVGVLIMMLTISPILAVVSLLAVPASLFVTLTIVRRSQQQFVAQWSSTGALNGHVEEMHTGHSIVKVFGRQREAIERFDEENERLYNASYRAQFISGIIQPAMTFISNLNYVAIAVIGGLRVAAGQAVHLPDHPDGGDRQRPPVGGRLVRAGLRAARRARGDPGSGRPAGPRAAPWEGHVRRHPVPL